MILEMYCQIQKYLTPKVTYISDVREVQSVFANRAVLPSSTIRWSAAVQAGGISMSTRRRDHISSQSFSTA
jgi:hypothetical protein